MASEQRQSDLREAIDLANSVLGFAPHRNLADADQTKERLAVLWNELGREYWMPPDSLMQCAAGANAEIDAYCGRQFGKAPIVIPCQPHREAAWGACPTNVDEQIREHGGKAVAGFLFNHCPGIVVEASRHVVWESPQSQLLCVSDNSNNDRQLLFLPSQRQFVDLVDQVHFLVDGDDSCMTGVQTYLNVFERTNALIASGEVLTLPVSMDLPTPNFPSVLKCALDLSAQILLTRVWLYHKRP